MPSSSNMMSFGTTSVPSLSATTGFLSPLQSNLFSLIGNTSGTHRAHPESFRRLMRSDAFVTNSISGIILRRKSVFSST